MAKRKKREPRDYRARLVIYDADTLTPEDRQVLANWLDEAAADLENPTFEMSKRYTARLMH